MRACSDLTDNLSLTNVLADNYSYAADGSSVTINLKKGITWQDGERADRGRR